MCVTVKFLKNAELENGKVVSGTILRVTPKLAADLIWREQVELVADKKNDKNEFNVLIQIQDTVKNSLKQNKKVKNNGNN